MGHKLINNNFIDFCARETLPVLISNTQIIWLIIIYM